MTMETAFYESAMNGIAISISFAFLVLILATCNLLVSFIATGCITSIVFILVGLMQMKDWELGVAEATSIVVLIGLSVDYVVHLAAEYIVSPKQSRKQKMAQAYHHMGLSIFSGCVTTMGAGSFMMLGELSLNRKFGYTITTTMAISFFISMVYFGALMHIVGPEKGFCDILQMF